MEYESKAFRSAARKALGPRPDLHWRVKVLAREVRYLRKHVRKLVAHVASIERRLRSAIRNGYISRVAKYGRNRFS